MQVKDEGDSQNPSYLEPEVTTKFLNRREMQPPQQTQQRQKIRTQKTQPSSKGKKKSNGSGLSPREKVLAKRQEEVDDDRSHDADAYKQPLPRDFFERNHPLLINIGGYIKKSGWVNINSQLSSFGSSDEPELVRELHDLHVCSPLCRRYLLPS